MRKSIWMPLLPMLIPACLWIAPSSGEGANASLSGGAIQLKIPELGDKMYAPGILRIPELQNLRRLVLHIPLARVHQVFPKLNTIGTGQVQSIKVRQNEVLCDIDLSLHEGRYYSLRETGNTVEVKVVPRPGADPIYASWVIAPPKQGEAWNDHQQIAGGAGPAAEMSKEGLVVREELENGQLRKLDQGLTASRRVFVQARFLRREESVSLRVRWVGEEGTERTISIGQWSGGASARGVKPSGENLPTLEGPVELDVGSNRLEVEVMHGYTSLSRSTFKILRRTPNTPSAVTGEKWAVVIGISDYRSDRLDLKYAHRDAEALRDFLIGKGGFRPDRVRFVSNQTATHQEIRTSLFNFLAATQPEDLVVIFLAGHGVQDKVNPDNYYFLVHDSQEENLGGTAIPMWDLGNVMDYTIRARRIMILADTCHSGAVLDTGGAGKLNFFNKYLEVLGRKKGRLVVTASQAHESSWEKSDLAQGVFTHSVLLGLSGLADDNPADGVVTAGELVDFIQLKVPEITKGEQHPSFSREGFDMNLPLAHVRSGQPARR